MSKKDHKKFNQHMERAEVWLWKEEKEKGISRILQEM